MRILMKGLNEERSVQRCISDFHDEAFVDKIIVIDGGSTDYTLEELKQFSKVEVYIHPWLDWFHDMEITQSNIAMSYIPLGALAFILDFDERMSPDLKECLNMINNHPDLIGPDTSVHFSRKTHEVVRFDGSPFAMLDDDGWPVLFKQIGQYPDYQCRMFRRGIAMKWINSPHHILIGYMNAKTFDADIIHYEKDDLRDRQRIERKWARAQARRKELGLHADSFECDLKPHLAKYGEPETWK
jgi:glycosyltransferase involved in cell wall biosynthesis